MMKYGIRTYPPDIPLHAQELAANFSKEKLNRTCPNLPYSLHTEYSFTSGLKSSLLDNNKYSTIKSAHERQIPMLWHSQEWVREFTNFIIELIGDHEPPKYIEVHPPFIDYRTFASFVELYLMFERIIKAKYPEVQILIENRAGTYYKGQFLISLVDDIIKLSQWIDDVKPNLRIALDIPQIYTAHNVTQKNSGEIISLLEKLQIVRHNVYGVHLWGKKDTEKKKRASHYGNLNDYFYGDMDLKKHFLLAFSKLFDDDFERLLVLEVNSDNNDVRSIIEDVLSVGAVFV